METEAVEIRRLQVALDKINEIATTAISNIYPDDDDRMLRIAIDLSFALGRIQAIAVSK